MLSKIVSDGQRGTPAFWNQVNKRLEEMENEIHVANFAFIITAFAKADILELEGFLMRTRRILLL